MTRRQQSIDTLMNGTRTLGSIPEEPERRSGARSANPPLSPKQTIARIHVTDNGVANRLIARPRRGDLNLKPSPDVRHHPIPGIGLANQENRSDPRPSRIL